MDFVYFPSILLNLVNLQETKAKSPTLIVFVKRIVQTQQQCIQKNMPTTDGFCFVLKEGECVNKHVPREPPQLIV